MEGCPLGTAPASSVGASQQKALVFSAWSRLWKKAGSAAGKEGERECSLFLQSNCGLILLTAENTVVKDAA